MKEKKYCVDNDGEKCQHHSHKWSNGHAGTQSGGVVYFLGFIGAAIFFVGKATTFWMGVLGFLQAIVWPVFVVYEALKFFIK